MLKFAALSAIFPKKLKSIRPEYADTMYSLCASDAIQADIRDAGQCTVATALHTYDRSLFLKR